MLAAYTLLELSAASHYAGTSALLRIGAKYASTFPYGYDWRSFAAQEKESAERWTKILAQLSDTPDMELRRKGHQALIDCHTALCEAYEGIYLYEQTNAPETKAAA